MTRSKEEEFRPEASATSSAEPPESLEANDAVSEPTVIAKVVEREYILAAQPTTPNYCRFLLPVLIILTHVAFIYGQVAIMWHLIFELDFEGTITATAWDSKLLFQAIGIPNPYNVLVNQTQELEVFTYGAAISKLWIGDGLSSHFVPRLGALILIVFSGFWPHMKLIMLQYYLFVKVSEKERSKGLYWLSSLGKFSIAGIWMVFFLVFV